MFKTVVSPALNHYIPLEVLKDRLTNDAPTSLRIVKYYIPHFVLCTIQEALVLIPLLQEYSRHHINPRDSRALSGPPKHCHTAGTAT